MAVVFVVAQHDILLGLCALIVVICATVCIAVQKRAMACFSMPGRRPAIFARYLLGGLRVLLPYALSRGSIVYTKNGLCPTKPTACIDMVMTPYLVEPRANVLLESGNAG